MGIPYRGTHRVAHAEVKATLFVHGVVQTRKLRERWPVVVKGVVTETVIGAAKGVEEKMLMKFAVHNVVGWGNSSDATSR